MKADDKNAAIVTKLVITSESGICQDKSGDISIRCPSCLTWKTLKDFGLRYMTEGSTLRNQPHCKMCRGSKHG